MNGLHNSTEESNTIVMKMSRKWTLNTIKNF